ncbi:Retroviral-like aspartic protease 1, partial [Trichinella nelsoni]
LLNILNLPDPFTTFKQLCLKRTVKTKDQRILQALMNEELNDDKPSQFLRRLQRLLGGASDDIVGSLFLSKLPIPIRMALVPFPDRLLMERAELADQIAAPQSTTAINAVSSDNGSFESRLERLESLFEKFLQCRDQPADDHRHPRSSRSPTTHRRRWLSPTRSGRRSPSPSNQDQRRPTCFYHRRFGDRAQNRCLYIMDKISKRRFLIDTGASVSLLPPTGSQKQPEQPASNKPILQAINGTPVSHLGKKTITVQLADLPALTWTFFVAEVGVAIIGADILHHHAITVDIKHSRFTMACNNAHTLPINGAFATESTDKYQSLLTHFYPHHVHSQDNVHAM